MELVQLIFTIAIGLVMGFSIGWLVAKAHTMDDYNAMYSHLTCEIVSRMTKAMRSLCMEQEDIDMVVERMGCKVIPAAVPCPATPPDNFNLRTIEDTEKLKMELRKNEEATTDSTDKTD